jgi:starch-binding outer membrane protein SusE/F
MKKKLLIIFVLGLFLSSCLVEDEVRDPIVELKGAPNLTAPGTITLAEDNASAVLTGFSWTEADFGYPAAITYALQVDKGGNDFATPYTLYSTSNLEARMTVGELNNKLLTFGLPGDWTSDVEFRLVASVSDKVDAQTSAKVAAKVTTYDVVVEYPKLFMPGSYQGWNAGDETTVVYSVKDNGRYQGYFWFPDETTEFKFTKVPGWEEENTIGDPDAGGQSGTLQIGGWGGNNIKVTTGTGYYLIKADLNAKTYTYLKTSWGLIGSATPDQWNSDQDMTYNATTNVWSITLNLTAGEIKFRANDGWDLNYGDNGPDGKLEEGGDNIVIDSAGNYTITLDLSGAIYTYTVKKN